jgi:simple sugar transport system substrate-binding protein
VVSNADAKNKRLSTLARIFLQQRVASIVELVTKVAVIYRHTRQLNIQPRLDGSRDWESGKNIKLNEIASGPTLNEEVSWVAAWCGHPDIKGMFAVDAGTFSGREDDEQNKLQQRHSRRL